MNREDLSRRDFLLAGPGLLVFFPLGPVEAFQKPAQRPARQGYPDDFNAYLRIGAEGRVTCLVGKVELGQGSMTALAQLLAEELDVTLDSVDMVMGDTDLCPWDMGTFGSLSIRQFGPVLRAAAAEARAVLLQMASERLQTPAEQLSVKAGVITGAAPGQRVSYAELVQGKRIERHLKKAPVKRPPAFTVIGQSPRRKDALEKITGRARYAGDVRIPGLLHARILRPPAHGASLKSVDTSAAEKAGARVVRDGDLIAVLHEHRDLAGQALDLIRAQFEPPRPSVNDRTIFDHLLKAAPPGRVAGESGQPGRRREACRQSRRGDVSEQLRCARRAGNAFRDGGDRKRQSNSLDRHSDAVFG